MDDGDAVQSALRKEREEGAYKLTKFREKLEELEEQFEMDSEEFLERYRSGELGDRQEFMEWKALIESVEHWERKMENLEKAS